MDLVLCQQCWLQHSPASINKPYTILLTIDWCPFSLCLNHMPAEISEWPEWKGEAKSLPCRDIDNHFHHSSSLDHPTRGKSMFWGEKNHKSVLSLPPLPPPHPLVSPALLAFLKQCQSTRWCGSRNGVQGDVEVGMECRWSKWYFT